MLPTLTKGQKVSPYAAFKWKMMEEEKSGGVPPPSYLVGLRNFQVPRERMSTVGTTRNHVIALLPPAYN
jgi:hypothetical protein